MLRYELPIWCIRSYMYFASLGIHGLVQRAGFDHLRGSKTQSGRLLNARLHHTHGKTQHTPGVHPFFFGWRRLLDHFRIWGCPSDKLMYRCAHGVWAVFKTPAGWSNMLELIWGSIYLMYLALSQSIFGRLPNKRCVGACGRCQHCEPCTCWRQRRVPLPFWAFYSHDPCRRRSLWHIDTL